MAEQESSVRDVVTAYLTAEALFAPSRRALYARVQTAIRTFKAVGREYKLYDGDWKYGWAYDLEFSARIEDVREDGVTIADYNDSDGHTLTVAEIENAEFFATNAAKRAKIIRDQEVADFHAARRARLVAELAELDASNA